MDAVFNPDTVKPENARQIREAKFDSQKFERKEFQELWKKINHQTYYTVDFKTEDLIQRAVIELNNHLRVSEINIQVTTGTLNEIKNKQELTEGTAMKVTGTDTHAVKELVNENVKLPGGFYINTPAGHYNPDWAIVFKEGTDIKHVYFVAETKGYSDDEVLDYRSAESVKIECARRHFATISNSTVTYDVVKSYANLRNVITK